MTKEAHARASQILWLIDELNCDKNNVMLMEYPKNINEIKYTFSILRHLSELEFEELKTKALNAIDKRLLDYDKELESL